MVVLYPSRSKSISTRSANFFGRKNSGASTWIKAAKDAILTADAFYMVFFFSSKERFVQRSRVSAILFFQNNWIFHLNIVGTRQATIRNRITERLWLEMTESILATIFQ